MNAPTTVLNGIEYPLNTTLRVAFEAQKANNHKPYIEVFKNIESMMLEKQIEILYLAFRLANPEAAKTYPQQMFLDYYLENFTLKQVMDQLTGVISRIMGDDEDAQSNANPAEVAEGN